MAYADQKVSTRRLTAVFAVIILHMLLAYALLSGLAVRVAQAVQEDLNVFDVEDEPPPPPEEELPPPPPPEIPIPPPQVIDLPPPIVQVPRPTVPRPPPPPRWMMPAIRRLEAIQAVFVGRSRTSYFRSMNPGSMCRRKFI